MFHCNQVCPGITHITDAMGVSFTLIEGKRYAVLFDAGYGTEDVRAFIRTLTALPVKVFLSHGHHDHVLGARWFDKTYLCTEDLDEFRERTGKDQRSRVAEQAKNLGVSVPEDYLDAVIAEPETIRFTECASGCECLTEDLGGLRIRVIRVPGHTPGSIVIHVPGYRMLLTGDDWNPCTWMWFPTSMRADRWRDSMVRLLRMLETESGDEIRTVLCSHQAAPRTGKELSDFLGYMTDERLKQAPPVDMGSPIHTHRIVRDQWTLIFDADKITT